MTIRPTQEADLPAILEILNREIREGVAHFGLEPQVLEGLEREWEASQGRFPWYSAVDASGLAGFCRLGPWKSRGAYAKTAEIGVYVDSSRQGQGVGSRLYEQMIPACFEAGFHTLLAGIRIPNKPCVRLHEKFGFEYCGALPEVGLKFGEWHSVGYWALVESARPTSPTR